MTVGYSMAVKNARLQVVLDAIGAGGKLEIGTAGMALVLATVELATPAGLVADGVLTFTMPQTELEADASGTPAAARIRSATDLDVVTGLSAGVADCDVILNGATMYAHQRVTITAATIKHF